MSEDGHDIGFNEEVESEGRTFHVQTEVVGRAETKILTNVLEGGRVRYSNSQSYPVHLSDMTQVRTIIENQHQQVVAKIGRGEIK